MSCSAVFMWQTDIFPFPISVILCGTTALRQQQYFVTLPTQRQQKRDSSLCFATSSTRDIDNVFSMFRLQKPITIWHLFKQSISTFVCVIHRNKCRVIFNVWIKHFPFHARDDGRWLMIIFVLLPFLEDLLIRYLCNCWTATVIVLQSIAWLPQTN